jgi:hypothetical protein
MSYIKWFGSAFKRLRCAAELGRPWKERWQQPTGVREALLVRLKNIVARMHNALAVTDCVSEEAAPFHGRPYLVIHEDRFVEAIECAITSDLVRACVTAWIIGWCVSLFERNPSVLSSGGSRRR